MVRAALVMELTHVASLYHDDVMDEARLRRGSASANARWGNTVAILVGDFLFARASEVVAELGPDYVRLQARTFARLVQGQIAETVGPSGADPLEHYLTVVADKTASLIATSALFGAKVAGADRSVAAGTGRVRRGDRHGLPAVRRHHRHHLRGDRQDPGHRPSRGHPDLADPAVPTDPPTPPHRRTLGCCSCWTPTSATTTTWPRRWRLLRAHPCVDEARAEVARRAERARSFLTDLPAGPARDALAELCDSVVTRAS